MRRLFSEAARWVVEATGSATTFFVAVGLVLVWALTGPYFNYSTTWQLVINTGTTIVTFLMVFLLQHAQNRDQRALQIKLDELLRAMHGARTGFVDIEDLGDDELEELHQHFVELQRRHAGDLPGSVGLEVEAKRESGKR